MAIVVASQTSVYQTLANSITFTKPSGTVDGDLLLALVYADTLTVTPPAGWTSEASSSGLFLFSRVASSEGASYQFTTGFGNNNGTITRVTGASTTSPVAASDLYLNASATSAVLPSVGAGAAGSGLIQMVMVRTAGAATWSPPGTATEVYDADATGGGFRAAGGHETVGAGASGTRTWTSTASADYVMGAIFAINPTVVSATPAKIRVRYRTNATFVVPAGVTQITVECEGGGGGGGLGSALFVGGGGGGGAYASSVLAVTPAASHAVVVGAQVAGSVAGNLSSFGTGPLVRGAGGGVGGAAGALNNGTAGPGGTTAASIGTTKVAGTAGVAGGAGGAGASSGNVIGGAGGAVNGGAGSVPGGGGGGGAILSGAGGTGAAGEVHVSWDIADVIGDGDLSRQLDLTKSTLPVVGEGLVSHTKLATVAKTFDLVGEGLVSRGAIAVAESKNLVGEGLTSATKAVVAAKTLNVVGEGLVTRGASGLTMARNVVGEGLVSSSKLSVVAKTFNLVGEGLVSSSKLVSAFRTFNLTGEGLVSRVLAVTQPRDVIGEGLVDATKVVAASKTFTLTGEGVVSREAWEITLARNTVGEGLVTEVHPVQAFRTFNLVGVGELLMSGPSGSTITIPLDELPTGDCPADWPVNDGLRCISGDVFFHEPPNEGLPVVGAVVTLIRDSDGLLITTTVTDAAGHYSFPRDTTDPNTYHVEVRWTDISGDQQGLSESGCVPVVCP